MGPIGCSIESIDNWSEFHRTVKLRDQKLLNLLEKLTVSSCWRYLTKHLSPYHLEVLCYFVIKKSPITITNNKKAQSLIIPSLKIVIRDELVLCCIKVGNNWFGEIDMSIIT